MSAFTDKVSGIIIGEAVSASLLELFILIRPVVRRSMLRR